MEMFQHSSVAPKVMSLETLKEITDNFSVDRELGSGTFGIVYKGVQNGKEIAVKQLQTQGHDDHKEFMKEFENLWRLRHPNIVQLLGYCYEIKREAVVLGDGRFVWADNIYRALCFEYMHNGSLRKHLYDEHHGHDWQTRFKIIKGTCEGLQYLHEGLERPMYHLDLKPENILLDKNMVPKLADFGLSKLVHNNQTQVTQSCIGTRGYLPPEYIKDNLVSNKLDIFSLGVVMIRIIAGFEGYFKKFQMSSQAFIDRVYTNWRDRLNEMLGCTSLEAECHQVKGCIEIAINCVDEDRQKRPTIREIVRRLNELEHVIDMPSAPCQLQQTSAAMGPGDCSTEVHVPTSSKEFGLPFQPYKHNGAQTDGCEEPNRILRNADCLYQSSLGTKQRHATVSGSTNPHTVINKLNKANETAQLWGSSSSMPNVVSQIQKLQLNTVQKGLGVPQQLQSMSGKMPFPAAAPEEDPVSIVFNIPREDNEMQVQGKGNDGGGGGRSTATSAKEINIGGRGVHDNNGGGKIGSSSGQPQNTKGVAPGGGAAAVGDGLLGGMPPLAAGTMRPPNMMMGGAAGFPGMYQMGGVPMDIPHNGNMQPGSGTGGGGASHGMPAGGMPASGSYQGGGGAGRSVPSGPEMRQASVATGNLLAMLEQRRQRLQQYYMQRYYMASMQQLGLGMSSGGMETPLTAMAGGDLMEQQYYTALMQQQQRDMSSPSWPEMLKAAITAGNLRAQQQFMAFMQQQQQDVSTRQDLLQAAMASRNQTAPQYTAAMYEQQLDMSSWPETLLAAMASMNQGSGIQLEKNFGPNRNG